MDLKSLLLDEMDFDPAAFAGQVVVVSGGGRGIGREVCRAFALLGAKVAIAEISESGRETEQIIQQEGGQALFVQTDVASQESVQCLHDTVTAQLGPASILVNNAILIPVKNVLDMEVELWDRVIAVNLRGNLLMCKAFAPEMISNGSGTIINMVSTDAMPGLSAYFASKQGITGLSQSLALEIGGAGMRVIAFAPGMVDTPGIRQAAEGLAPRLGMTMDQFMSLSLHPAYAGFMPVEHAAAATAYLAAKLADDFQGEVVNGFQVLERAGLIRAPGSDVKTSSLVVEQQAPAGGVQAAIEQVRRILAGLEASEAEFKKMPLFFRPLARNGFKMKAGQSIPDWQRSAAMLLESLERVQAGDASARSKIINELHSWNARLDKLAAYYRGTVGEAAAFSKDEAFLSEVRRTAEERTAAVEGLAAALKAL